MYEQEMIKKALSGLHASENTLEEVFNMANQKKSRCRSHPARTVLAVALILVLCFTTAFAADFVLNKREIFIFDSIEALLLAQKTDDAMTAGSVDLPNSAVDNADIDTVAEGVAQRMESGYFGDETLLLDKTDNDAGTPWERKRVTEYDHEDYGLITVEYMTGAAYAQRLVIGDELDWDLSAVAETMTPDAGGQIIIICSEKDSHKRVIAEALLGYTTPEGERFQIEYCYDADARYLQKQEFILGSAYDNCYTYVTADQVEVLVEVYDGQIWASAVHVETGCAVYLYTTGCTTAELEALLDALTLSIPLQLTA